MQIPSDQIAYKKQIGKLDSAPVWEIGMRGGLHLVVAAKKSGVETLGVGPHRAVALHIARKREADLKLTELNKAEHVELEWIEHLLPKYEGLTSRMRKSQGLD